PVPVGDLAHHLEPRLAQALKTVGRRARLEGAAAHDLHALLRDAGGDGLDLLAAFERAGAGHHHHLLAADHDVPDPDLRAFGPEGACGQLVRRADADDFVDAFDQFEV